MQISNARSVRLMGLVVTILGGVLLYHGLETGEGGGIVGGGVIVLAGLSLVITGDPMQLRG